MQRTVTSSRDSRRLATGYSTPVIRSLSFLVLTTSTAGAALAQQQSRPRCRDCTAAEARAVIEARATQVRDTLRRVGGLEGQIEQVAAQWLLTAQQQSELRQALEAMSAAQASEASRSEIEATVRELRQRMSQITLQSQTLRKQLASLCDRNAKPDGYMGITFSATMQADAAESGTEVFRFAENPIVETVEPDSPAERAGVAKGDEIVEIDRRPVVGRPIVFSRLLRPGNRLPIRVRRDGDTRDLVLVIRERPPSLDNGCPFLDARVMAAFGEPLMISPLRVNGAIVRVPDAPTPAPQVTGKVTVRRASPGQATTVTPAPAAPATPVPAAPGQGQTSVYVFSSGSSVPMTIAGATIVRTNADLRETFGVKSGVLVLDVARGTPAYASGLRGGDVIVSVGRVPVTSPLSIQRAIVEASPDNQLTLRIIRKKREQSLVLRW